MKPILPPVYLLAALVLMIALWLVAPGPRLIPTPWNLTGVLLAMTGVGLNLVGDWLFQRAKTTMNPFGQPHALLTTGVFAYSRHPMYLGMVLLVVGLAILIGYASPFVPACLLWAILNWRFIPYEERVLSERFGGAFDAYRQHTRRWLGASPRPARPRAA
jgi:protein-S-isoprenylcysteine O-methyltransferase Ste14